MNQTEELFNVIQSISRKLRDIKEQEIENIKIKDFSLSSFKYIEAIYKMKSTTFIEMAKELKLSKPTVTIMVNKLIEKGFIQKTKSSKDGRVYYLNLTEKGQKIIESYEKIYKKFSERIAELFDKEEMDTLISLLKKI